MAKFAVVGLTDEKICGGERLILKDVYSKLIVDNTSLKRSEVGNVIVYGVSCSDVNDEFKKEYGTYDEYQFIKETVRPKIEKVTELNVLGVIDESELPENAEEMVKI